MFRATQTVTPTSPQWERSGQGTWPVWDALPRNTKDGAAGLIRGGLPRMPGHHLLSLLWGPSILCLLSRFTPAFWLLWVGVARVPRSLPVAGLRGRGSFWPSRACLTAGVCLSAGAGHALLDLDQPLRHLGVPALLRRLLPALGRDHLVRGGATPRGLGSAEPGRPRGPCSRSQVRRGPSREVIYAAARAGGSPWLPGGTRDSETVGLVPWPRTRVRSSCLWYLLWGVSRHALAPAGPSARAVLSL